MCGGIYLGYNYNGVVRIAGCTVYYNTGLAVRNLAETDPNAAMDFSHLSADECTDAGLPVGAVRKWTRPPR